MATEKLTRRLAMRQIMAGGLVAAAGCADSGDDGVLTSRPASPAKRISHRLYYLYFNEEFGGTSEVLETLNQNQGAGSQLDVVDQAAEKPEYRILAWLHPDSLKKIESLPTVAKVELLKPEQIPEVGKPDQAKGHLYVVLAPNSWHLTSPKPEFHSMEAVAAELAETLKDVKEVEVSAVRTKSWEEIHGSGFFYGDAPGQILIRFSGGAIPDKALDAVRSHPQTATLLWGASKQYSFCPPCGQG